MAYPAVRRAIESMIEDVILERSTTIAIVRKGLGRLPRVTDTESLGTPTDPWGTHAHIDQGGGTHSQFGSIYEHGAGTSVEFYAPGMRRYADWLGVEEVAILATVTQEGNAGASFSLALEYEGGVVPFAGSSPTVPLDEVGVHISGYVAIDWPPDATIAGERPALLSWFIDNPSGSAGTVGLGLVQLFARS